MLLQLNLPLVFYVPKNLLLLCNNQENITTGFQLLWQRKLITLSSNKHVINVSISRPFQQTQNREIIHTHTGMQTNTGNVFIAMDSTTRIFSQMRQIFYYY